MINLETNGVQDYGIVSPSKLRDARSCAKSMSMQALSINTKAAKKNIFYKNVLSLFKEKFSSLSLNELKSELREYIKENLEADWYELTTAYGDAIEKISGRWARFSEYFKSRDFEVLEVSVPYELMYSTPVGTPFYAFHGIKDTADFIVKDGETVRVIKVIDKVHTLSAKARTDANKVIYSPELLALKAGFVEKYPECSVELWSLRSKDDTTEELAEYEAKQGKNIVSCTFPGFESKALLMSEIVRSLGVQCPKKECRDCRHYDYCVMQTSTRFEDEKKACAENASMHAIKPTMAQQRVINHIEGPMSVIAVPGAGKTRSLVERVVNLKSQGINLAHVLLVTFTNKACQELADRLEVALGIEKGSEGSPVVRTFHRFAYDILKENPGLAGGRFALASDTAKAGFIKGILNREDVPRIGAVSYDGATSRYGIIRQLIKWFDYIKENGEDTFITDYPNKDTANILAVYHIYSEEWRRAGYITFDELILKVNELFEKYADLSETYAYRFQYIMVDEFQDTDAEQAKFIYSIVKHHNNIVVVGDDDQSIYGWRGGDNHFLINFGDDFPDADVVFMNDNFRSCEPILKACNALIATNTERTAKAFVAHKTADYKPVVLRGVDVNLLNALVDRALSAGFKPGDIAIIGRNNKVLFQVSDFLTMNGKKVLSPKDYLIKDTVFMAILDCLELTQDWNNDRALYRLLKIQGVPDELLYKAVKSKSLYDNLVGAGFMPSFNSNDLPEWRTLVNVVKDIEDGVATRVDTTFVYPELVKALFSIFITIANLPLASNFKEAVSSISKNILHVDESHPCIKALLDEAELLGIEEYDEMLAVMQQMVTFEDERRVGYSVSEDYINLLTAHDSKGKEFPLVILYGLEDFEDTPEEIRLLFVAMSRAKKQLFVTEGLYAQSALLKSIAGEMEVRSC